MIARPSWKLLYLLAPGLALAAGMIFSLSVGFGRIDTQEPERDPIRLD